MTIVPGDERIVPLGDPLSNVTQLGKLFIPKGARVIPIVPKQTEDYKSAGRSADALMQDLHWPLDLCLLGVGGDGHTASIFPGPDFDEALNGPKERRMLGVMPDPLPPEAPVARVTLSRQGIVTARALMIAVTGKDNARSSNRQSIRGRRRPIRSGPRARRCGAARRYPLGALSRPSRPPPGPAP